jgi:DNA-binding CsgD family transcriptional regulator
MAGAPSRWPLVGRDEELTLLDAVARTGPVVVAGAAGVGKSRLVASWRETVDEPTTAVVATRASATIPFGAFAPWAPTGLDPGADRLGTLRTVADALAAVGGTVVVDDAHLLDPASAALVLHLVRHTPVGVVATLRSGEPCPDPITALWVHEDGTRIDLRPLSEDECATLAARRLGGRLHASARRRLWALAAGNPMHLRETTEAALEQGRLVAADGAWSWTGSLAGTPRLVDLVEARLGRVDADDRRVLELVALGEPLPIEVLGALAPEERVEALEAVRLLALRATAAGEVVGLGHPLYGEVLRATTSRLRARQHHHDLAVAATDHDLHRRDPLRVALWWQQAEAPSGDAALLVAASTRAMVLQDYPLSAGLAEAGVAAGGGVPALLAVSRVHGLTGRPVEAAAALDAAAGTARTPAEVAEVALSRTIGAFWRDRHCRGAATVVEEARATLPPDRWAGVAATGGCVAVLSCDLARARALATDAIAEAPPGGVAATLGRVVEVLAATWQGDGRPLLAAYPDLLPAILSVIALDPVPAALAVTGYQAAMVLEGQLDVGVATFEQILARAGQDDDVYLAMPALLTARTALDQGRVATAADRARQARELMGEDRPYVFGRVVVAGATLATARAQAGDARGAAEAVARAEARADAWIPDAAAHLALARAWTLAAAGQLTDAADGALAVADRMRAAGAGAFEAIALLDATRMGAAARTAAPLADLTARAPGPWVVAAAALARALADHDRGALDEVSNRFAAMGAVLLAAEAAAQATIAHGRAGIRHAEAASRRRAQDLLARCEGAATPLLAGLDRRAVADELTAREREVAAMAAAGRTNREIATALGVSVRTVNSHLNHAYAKVGTSDREELARLLRPAEPR